jgi:hypothetical protein
MASFAEFEREMTASRIAEARAYLRANGRRVAGAVPFVYTADPRTKQLVVVPEEGTIVSRMFQWATSKMTPSTIAAVANAQGWRTRKGQPWTARQVHYTLRNHVYAAASAIKAYWFKKVEPLCGGLTVNTKRPIKERVERTMDEGDSGKVPIERIKPPDDSARDEAEAIDRSLGTKWRMSDRRHR